MRILPGIAFTAGTGFELAGMATQTDGMAGRVIHRDYAEPVVGGCGCFILAYGRPPHRRDSECGGYGNP